MILRLLALAGTLVLTSACANLSKDPGLPLHNNNALLWLEGSPHTAAS